MGRNEGEWTAEIAADFTVLRARSEANFVVPQPRGLPLPAHLMLKVNSPVAQFPFLFYFYRICYCCDLWQRNPGGVPLWVGDPGRWETDRCAMLRELGCRLYLVGIGRV